MKIYVIPATQLTADHIAAWSRIQLGNPGLINPFFRPEFTSAVAAEREGVDVAVWEQGGEPVGFLPFERMKGRTGRAVGYYINQFQGAITRPEARWSPRDVVRAAGLRRLTFDHLAAAQPAFSQYQYVQTPSHYLDLAQGFDHYKSSRGKSAKTFVSHVQQKDRKASRDVGEVRVESNTLDRAAFTKLLEWKIDQSKKTHIPCVYDLDWVMRLHERLLDANSEHFSGMLFSLYMGDRHAGGFFCLRSGGVLQGSILGYDRELSPYAPGLVLLMRVAQMCPELGITRIDMGAGDEFYKEKISSGFENVSEGNVCSQSMLAPMYRHMYQVKDRLRGTKLRGPVRAMRAWMLTVRIRMGFTD